MRTITILLRKHAELRKTRLIWQKRMDLLHDTDEAKRYNLTKQILERPQPSAIQMNEGMRKYVTQRKISQILPSYSILKAVRNGNPTEPNVVYQHYTKKMRILRVLNTAHGFINRHFKDPTLYLPIQPFYGSLTLQDGIVISMKRDGWTESLYQKLLAQRRNLPMIENVLERRCILRKDPKERDVSKFTQEEIIRIRAQSQHSIDVRATTYPSQQNMTDALKLASSYSKPARRNDISLSRIGPRHGEVDANNVKLVLEEEVKTETINAIKQRRAKNKKPYLLLPNGIPILPLDRISTKTYPIREDPIVHPYPSSIKTAELLEKCGLGFCGLKASEEFVKKFANEMKRMQDERHNLVWPGIGRVFKEKGGTVKELDGGEEESEVVLKLSYIPSKSTKIPSNYVIRLKDNNITELHQLPNVSTLSDYSRIPIERKMKCFEKSYADSEAMEDDAIPTYESLYINNSLYDIQQDYLDSDDRKTLSITLNGRLEAVLQARRKGVKYNEKQFDYCIKLDTVKPGIKLDAVASAETLDTVINGEKLDTVTAGENLDTVPSCSNVVTVKPSIVKQRNLLQNLDWKKMMENKLDKAQRFRLVPVENGTKNEFWLIDRDGDQDEEGVTEIKLSVDDAASDGDKKLMLRRVEDRDKLFPQLDQIINENIQKVIGYFDEYRQKDGAIKEQSKDDDLKAVVLLEFDSVVANLPVIDLSNMRIKASFDEDEDEPRIIFSCQKNKKVINMKQDIVNGQVNFSIAVREDPFEDLNEKPSETLITKYETDNSVLPVLARPHIKSTIVKRLSKWSEKRRRRWLNVLKYRFLRRKTMRLNKTVRSTVRVVCDKRPSTSKNITSEANDRDEAGKQSTEFRKLAIRKRLASMRNKKGDNEHEAKSPVKLANELASSLPNSGVSTPMRSRLPTHHDESDQHLNTPVEKSPQPELFNTVSELLLATKLKTLDQDSDLYKPVFVEDSEIPESMVEVKNDKDLCAFRFDRQSDDLFVADNGIKDVLSGPTPIGKTSYQEDIENPLDVISLPTMGPSKILKMRAAQVPPRIQKKHERIRERLEKEAAEYKVAVPEDKPKEEEESQLPSADSLAPQRVYTYGNEPSNSQRVVMFRSGATPPVYSRPVHTNTAGGQVRTYVVHSQMNPPPQQHFTSAGQPVSIHQPAPSTSTHNQHYVYSQSNNDHNKFPQPSSISYRPMTIQKSRPKPARPGNPQIGRRIGRNDSVGTEGRELTVRETLQRLTMNKGAARAGPAPPGQRPSFYPKAQGQRAQIPRPERPTLKRRLEDPSSLQVELQPMESEKRRKIAPKEGTAQPKPADDQLKPSTSSTKKPNILPST
ncbi:unnamed protein product [Bursaphelenchus okinawaensis]|uniref:Uncharacterized protein n=1 Tax=Bursaphelenchus okinawaensis TaxID=465554 RepID=A0A811KHB4_9BILA|nr:unnamed protein product [Bursaphelenchus okinawaensis]CAG9102931.1 unnamed protein product [Bursaphelenchus okinawaensis]